MSLSIWGIVYKGLTFNLSLKMKVKGKVDSEAEGTGLTVWPWEWRWLWSQEQELPRWLWLSLLALLLQEALVLSLWLVLRDTTGHWLMTLCRTASFGLSSPAEASAARCPSSPLSPHRAVGAGAAGSLLCCFASWIWSTVLFQTVTHSPRVFHFCFIVKVPHVDWNYFKHKESIKKKILILSFPSFWFLPIITELDDIPDVFPFCRNANLLSDFLY